MGDDYKKVFMLIKKSIDKKMIKELNLEKESEKAELLAKALSLFLQQEINDVKKEINILEKRGIDTYFYNRKLLLIENKLNVLKIDFIAFSVPFDLKI